jgi:hypothetical protein
MSCCNGKENLPHCPSKMHDGRAFTDYRPRCAINAELLYELSKKNMMMSSYESRVYLQNNADYEMEKQRQRSFERLAPCAPCQRNKNDAGTMHPERYVVRCDAVSCTRVETNPSGLGDGRM